MTKNLPIGLLVISLSGCGSDICGLNVVKFNEEAAAAMVRLDRAAAEALFANNSTIEKFCQPQEGR